MLTRQKIPTLNQVDLKTRREGAAKGGYVCVKESGKLEVILIATGSELQHAIAAAKEIGAGARVVSMPCMERFDRQADAYREEVLPAACKKRVAIEAGVTGLWYKYVGSDGKVIGIERFGISAPGDTVMEELGITSAALLEAAKAV